MPPIAVHLRLAQDVVAALGLSLLEQHLGAFLLGSTAPDLRNINGWARERTHFTTLDAAGHGHGLENMFTDHPHLAQSDALDPESAAFVAGYRTHLVVDDAWIGLVYRPYFGETSPLAGSAMANVFDRATQFELDNAERENREQVAAWRNLLEALDVGFDLQFLVPGDVARWRQTVVNSLEREPTWERFRALAEGVLVPGGKIEQEALVRFLDGLPDTIHEVHRQVNPDAIAAFRQQAFSGSVSATATYLHVEVLS